MCLNCCCYVCAGPLVLHVAKLFPKNDASSFDAYGRIFSGTLRPGDEVRLSQQTSFNRRFIFLLS
jgi:translation elongation factor EF-G